MVLTLVALLIGLAIFGGGLSYFFQEKKDVESRKIYGLTALAGAVIAGVIIVKMTI